jgi:fructosamine-3-kinase
VDRHAAALVPVLAEALGADIAAMVRLRGGDVAEAFRVELVDGRVAFAKTHHDPPPHFFVTEAAGLRWMADAGAVRVPEVLSVGDRGSGDGPDELVAHLALSWIEEGSAHAGTEAALGADLAALHRSGAPCFGREDRRTTGSRRLPNEPVDSWAEHYGGQRLVPLARLAADTGALPPEGVGGLEDVAGRLDELGGPAEPPARLHGDLWAGNRLVDRSGASWLIDPACHGGHREFDLAMMRLFGGFGPACFDAYAAHHPLAPGWEDRVPLHQLAPLAVHAIKFGGGYVGATLQALDRVLGRP